MSYFSSIFDLLLSKIEDFSMDVFREGSVTDRRFLAEMMFGMLKSGSTVLGNIVHSLSLKCQLKKGIERFSRHLGEEFPKGWEEKYRKLVISQMPRKSLVFCVDDSDIAKIYGRKFEDLGTVRDASSPDKKLVKGYHVTSIVGLSENERQPIPVFDEIHSSATAGYTSVNDITFSGISYCCIGLSDFSATFIFDRGYDDVKFFNHIEELHQYFLIRGTSKRNVMEKRKKINVFEYAKRYKGKIATKIRIKGMEYDAKITVKLVKLSKVKRKLWLIICWTDADIEEPLKIFFTNAKLDSKEGVLEWSRRYGERWKIEEFFRFKKTQMEMENFRVRSLTAINNILMIQDFCVYFLAMLIEGNGVIYHEAMRRAKDYGLKSIVKYYQLEDGLRHLMQHKRVQGFECGRRKREKQISLEKEFKKASQK